AIRKEVESGLAKIRKILGDKFETKVILAVEKHRHKAEITISPRNGPIVGLAQANDMKLAVSEALGHIEKQALKHKTRIISKKRKSHKKWNGQAGKPAAAEPQTAVGLTESTAVPVRPMTLEEAIKECHFRDRDVFVFRDPKGKLMVLHRTRDGKMELIEAP